MVDDRGFNMTDLADLLCTSYNVIALRRRNSANWRPEELKQLAKEFGMPTDAIISLKKLASRIDDLPDFIRTQLLKEARLSKHKFAARYVDYNSWHYTELEQLACTLRIWQDTKKLDTLLNRSTEKIGAEVMAPAIEIILIQQVNLIH
jgi:hypothetical protein